MSEKQTFPEQTARDQDLYYAERMIEFFGEDVCYVPAWGAWYVYNGTHWARDTGNVAITGMAQRTTRRLYANALAVLDFERRQVETENGVAVADLSHVQKAAARAQASQNTHRFVAIIQAAQALPGVARAHTEFDAQPLLLPCANGTLELRTGTLRKSSRYDYMTRSIPIPYKADAPAPRWEAFLARVLPDSSVREFMQRWFGYCLTGDVGERLFVVLYGGGANGKSVMLETMQRVLGAYATVMPPTLLMSRKAEAHPTELAGLAGARLAVSSEVKEGQIFDESAVKRLTGNDTLTARRMREDYWQFDPTHKLMLAVNHRPHVTDTSDSFWDRMALVPFSVRIPESERQAGLKHLLYKEEASGILAWAVRGLQDFLQWGMRVPDAVKQAATSYRSSEDTIGRFIAERCALAHDGKVTTARLTAEIRGWTVATNAPAPSPRKLAERLRELGCFEYRTATARGWQGLRILGDLPGASDGEA